MVIVKSILTWIGTQVTRVFAPSTVSLPHIESLSNLSQQDSQTLTPGVLYQLSESQYDKLYTSANFGGNAFLVPSPKLGDPANMVSGLDELNREFKELASLGLVADVSENFKEQVAEAIQQRQRVVRFYALTQEAFYLFRGSKERKPS